MIYDHVKFPRWKQNTVLISGCWQPVQMGKPGDPDYKITVACPACGAMGDLENHGINEDGEVWPPVICPVRCGFEAIIHLEEWEPEQCEP